MRLCVLSAILAILFASCSSALIAIDDAGWNKKKELSVKGRNGFLSNYKLSFGEFKTTTVKRSWAKGGRWGFGIGSNDWADRLNIEFVRRKQTIRFNLVDASGNESQVTAFSKVRWTDLTTGNNPNSVVNIIGDILQIGDAGTNTYAVRIAISKDEQPWDLLIDNNAAQRQAKTNTGLLARSKSEYYILTPVYKLKNKQGNAVALPSGGSVGFEFRMPGGKTVAAVSLIDNGMVYFSNLSVNERFLLANAAALLLQQKLDEE